MLEVCGVGPSITAAVSALYAPDLQSELACEAIARAVKQFRAHLTNAHGGDSRMRSFELIAGGRAAEMGAPNTGLSATNSSKSAECVPISIAPFETVHSSKVFDSSRQPNSASHRWKQEG